MSEAIPTPAEVENVLRTMVPTLGSMGMEVLEVGRRRVRTLLPFATQNGNHIGTVYAGVLFSFLEATGGALVLVAFDVSRFIPVVVEGTIRYVRPVRGAVTCDLTVSDEEIDAVHRTLERDPKSSWTLNATAEADDGSTACEADLVYRFRRQR